MKKVKVLKNFKCNGVSKSVGQYLSEEEGKTIGDKMGGDLLHNDFIIVEGVEESKPEQKNSAKKPTKKPAKNS